MQEIKQEKSQIKQKILLYLNQKGISEYSFYKESGITRGILQQNNGISEENLARFLAYAPDVNLEWLLIGEGDMLKTKCNPYNTPSSNMPVSYRKDNDFPPIQQDTNGKLSTDTRPRIPFDAAAGSLAIAIDSISNDQCEQLPLIPTFPRYDFTIFARGDSMTPEIMSGDELACAFVNERRFIQWGRTHVLDTAQGVVVKRIFHQEDSILCKSININYPDFDIPKEDIYHIAIVVGLIRHF